jgi:DNA-binding SARP family transcriptional activator
MTAIFTGANPTDYFIFGGMGVASGRQEDTQHPVWSLHKLDLKDLNWKKVWQWKSYKYIISYYTAAWSNSNMNEFYTIVTNFGINSTSTLQRLALLSLSDSNITFVGNTLPRPRKGLAPYPLYVDYETGIVYFLDSELHQKDSTPVVFVARTPILSESDYIKLLENTKPAKIARLKDMLKYSMLFMAVIVLPVGFVILFKKKRKKKMLEATQKLRSAPYSVKSNYITLFGGLTIIDKNGTVVKEGFTPKLIELFSLILFYSSHDEARGISFSQLDNLLWFDLPPENLKNNRNVAFSRLRAVIKSDSGISLITEQDSVRLKLPPGMTNEAELFYKLTLKNHDPLNIRKTSKFFTIISRGIFLKGIKSEWAHEAREEVTSKIIKISIDLMAFYCEQGEYQKCLQAAETVSNHSLLSEEVLRYKIIALIKLDRTGEAADSFKIFCAEYKLRYKEEYGYDFDEFLDL